MKEGSVDARSVAHAVAPKPVRGLAAWAYRVAEAAQQRVFEWWLGVSTAGNVYHQDGVGKTGRVFYTACQWIPVRRALRRLGPEPSDVFVDLGVGKGQALLIAARLPYGHVIGVEVDDELAQAAASNVKSSRPRLRAGVINVVRTDVRTWRLPDDVCVVFLYCPFVGQLFHEVLEGVFDSHDRRPRDLYIVYVFPFEHNWLLSTGRVQVEHVQPAKWPTKPWWWQSSWVIVTYRVIQPGSSHKPPRSVSPSEAAARHWSGQNDHRFWVAEPGAEKVYSDL